MTDDQIKHMTERCRHQAKLLEGHLPAINKGRFILTEKQDARYMAAYSVSAAIGLLEECAVALCALAEPGNGLVEADARQLAFNICDGFAGKGYTCDELTNILTAWRSQPVAATDAEVVFGRCGDNRVLPSRIVGCGEEFGSYAEIYRCTHCDAPFHKECAEHHFQNETILTQEHLDGMTEEEKDRAEAVLRADAERSRP